MFAVASAASRALRPTTRPSRSNTAAVGRIGKAATPPSGRAICPVECLAAVACFKLTGGAEHFPKGPG